MSFDLLNFSPMIMMGTIKIKGVRDVMILLEEGKVMLKVNKHETIHEASIIRLLGGKHGVS